MVSQVEHQNKVVLKPTIEKADIELIYLAEKCECCGLNDLIKDNRYKIEIYLGSLMSRKNMAYQLIVKKINYYFLLEFVCVILQEQGIWHQKLCKEKGLCNIEKVILSMKNLMSLKKRHYPNYNSKKKVATI